MKKIILAIFCAALLLFTACGSTSGGNGSSNGGGATATKGTADVELEGLVDELSNQYELPVGQKLDEVYLSELYDLKSEDFTDYCVMIPLMNVKVNEVAVLRCKEESQVADVTKALETRRDTVAQGFKQYLPDQYEIAQNGIIGSAGKYVYLIIDEKAAEMEQTILEKLQ